MKKPTPHPSYSRMLVCHLLPQEKAFFRVVEAPTPTVQNCRGGVSPPANIVSNNEKGRRNASPTEE